MFIYLRNLRLDCARMPTSIHEGQEGGRGGMGRAGVKGSGDGGGQGWVGLIPGRARWDRMVGVELRGVSGGDSIVCSLFARGWEGKELIPEILGRG